MTVTENKMWATGPGSEGGMGLQLGGRHGWLSTLGHVTDAPRHQWDSGSEAGLGYLGDPLGGPAIHMPRKATGFCPVVWSLSH
jgi:hypothetical protein